MEKQVMPAKLFISYAHKDQEFCEELVKQLKSSFWEQESISVWDNRQVSAGSELQREINKQLEDASIILLLISADFLSSNYYNTEMKHAMQRHNAEEVCVIPILLRPVDWENAPFAKLQPLPKSGKFITNYPDQDTVWLEVVRGIRSAMNKFSLSEPSTKLGTNNEINVPTNPSIEANISNPNTTSIGGIQQVQQGTSSGGPSSKSPFKSQRRLATFLSGGVLLLIVVLLIASHLSVGEAKIQSGATTLQFKEIVTEGNPVPVSIVQGSDKNIWFTNDQGEIRKITSDNSITKIRLSSGIGGGATGLTGITNGPDKNIWFTMTGKPVIGRFNVNADSFSYFNLLSAQDIRGTAITTGPDRNLWYVLGGISTAKIGCMTRMGALCGEYDLGSGVNPSSIISAGGKLWFTEIDGIGWMIPGLDTKPHIIHGITALNMAFDSSNKQIWFTEPGSESLGHITLDGSILAEIPLTNLTPESIAIGSDDTIWFTAWSNGAKQPGGKIEHFSSDGKKRIASYDFPTASLPIHGIYEYNNGNGITVASNGQIWFIEYQGTAGPAKIGYSQQ